MRGTVQLCLLALALLGSSSASAAVTVMVDCAAGDKIEDAIEANATANKIIVEISGICVENVEIRRDNVTLKGSDPTVDGIEAKNTTKAFSAALFIRDARNIKVKRLQLSAGATAGLRVENAWRRIEATNCRIVNNTTYGVIVLDGRLAMSDTTIMNNLSGGIVASEGGIVTCTACDILDNPDLTTGNALRASLSGAISVSDSTISGSRSGAVASTNSEVNVFTSTLDVDLWAVLADQQSEIYLSETPFTGSIIIDGYSSGTISDSVQTAGSNPFNFVDNNSSFQTQSSVAGATSLASDLDFGLFSNGRDFGGSTFQAISCGSGSDFVCGGTETKTSSSCGTCP